MQRQDSDTETLVIAPTLLASNGGASSGYHPIIPVHAWGISSDAVDRTGEGDGSAAERAGLGIIEEASPALRARPNNSVAYQCQGSNVGEMGALRKGNGNTAGGVPFVVDVPGVDLRNGILTGPVTHPLQAGGHGPDPSGTPHIIGGPFNVQAQYSEGRGPHASAASISKCLDGHGLNPDCQQGGTVVVQPYNIIGLGQNSSNHAYPTEISGCLQSKGLAASGNEAGTLIHQPAIAFQERGRDGGRNLEFQEDQSYALRAISGGGCGDWMRIAAKSAVRRLTPTECERLMGFPDGYSAVPYRCKTAADGNRYKALGNSIVVPCLTWIGQRIDLVEGILSRCESRPADDH
jgi:hypothetical protein